MVLADATGHGEVPAIRRVCQRRCGRYDTGEGRRRWRALDVGTVQAVVEADAPRVFCPEHELSWRMRSGRGRCCLCACFYASVPANDRGSRRWMRPRIEIHQMTVTFPGSGSVHGCQSVRGGPQCPGGNLEEFLHTCFASTFLHHGQACLDG